METIEQEPLSERDQLIQKILYNVMIELPLNYEQAMIVKRGLEYTYDIAFYKADSAYIKTKNKDDNTYKKRV